MPAGVINGYNQDIGLREGADLTGSQCSAGIWVLLMRQDQTHPSHRPKTSGRVPGGWLPATLSGSAGQWMKVRSVQRWSKAWRGSAGGVTR